MQLKIQNYYPGSTDSYQFIPPEQIASLLTWEQNQFQTIKLLIKVPQAINLSVIIADLVYAMDAEVELVSVFTVKKIAQYNWVILKVSQQRANLIAILMYFNHFNIVTRLMTNEVATL